MYMIGHTTNTIQHSFLVFNNPPYVAIQQFFFIHNYHRRTIFRSKHYMVQKISICHNIYMFAPIRGRIIVLFHLSAGSFQSPAVKYNLPSSRTLLHAPNTSRKDTKNIPNSPTFQLIKNYKKNKSKKNNYAL